MSGRGGLVRSTLLCATVGVSMMGWNAAPVSAESQGCATPPSGGVAITLVIASGRTPRTQCVVVASAKNGNGLTVLAEGGHSIRMDPDNPGFVCAIDGVPSTGCGTDGVSGFWGYWHGTGGRWTFSSVGAASFRLPTGCAVEGWTWVSNPSATGSTPPPPAVELANECIIASAPVITAPPPTSPAPPVTSRPSISPSLPATTAAVGEPPAPGAGVDVVPSTTSIVTTTIVNASSSTTSLVAEDVATTTSSVVNTGSRFSDADASAEVLGRSVSRGSASSTGASMPAIGAGVAVVALAGAALVRSRRGR